jgi:N-acetylmuramoyl-L-alanine amidase
LIFSTNRKIQLVLFFLFLTSTSSWGEEAFVALPLADKRIVIDAGHGVLSFQGFIINEGQRGYFGQVEHRTAFDIAKKLGQLLEKEGAHVIYTRTNFDYWRQGFSPAEDNKNRALFANQLQADILLSIHCDWSPSSKVSGVTTLYETSKSRALGDAIHRRMVGDLKAKDRKLVNDNFTILDFAQMPALIIETGFLSNRSEARKLSDKDYQMKVARAITSGVKNYFSN